MSLLTSQFRFFLQRIQKHSAGRLLCSVAVLLLVLFATASTPGTAEAAGSPTVNGLFFGDGDYLSYVPIATSESGSKMYVYFDNPTIYVALVVDRAVNDNVFSPKINAVYTQSAGWSNHRDAKRTQDSEYAQFELNCEAGTAGWNWQQGYAGVVDGTWVSNENVGGGNAAATPPSYASSSSWAWNLNNYEANYPAVAWDMYTLGTDIKEWKSPFNSADPDNVPGLEGYPTSGPLGYSRTFEWEWSMVYEWSADLSGCGTNPIFVVAGSSHHSPGKMGSENDNFPVVDNPTPLTDYGDLPDSYGTLTGSGGAGHIITVGGVYLGAAPDPELDGQPSAGAIGDGLIGSADEDGATRSSGTWTNGSTTTMTFDIQGTGASADIGMWIDWNGDGDFNDPGEFYSYIDRPVGTGSIESIVVPDASIYTELTPLNVRVRIFNDVTDAPGGSLDASDYAGTAMGGEVEDHQLTFDAAPTAVGLYALNTTGSGQTWPLVILSMILLALTVGFLSRHRRQGRN